MTNIEDIWNVFLTHKIEQNLEEKEKIVSCCDNVSNLVNYPEGVVCSVCGIVKNESTFGETDFSDQVMFLNPGCSSNISSNKLTSKKLIQTNYKINTSKTFQQDKSYWMTKCYIQSQIEKNNGGISDIVVNDAINLFKSFEGHDEKKNTKTITRRNVRTSVISACLYLSCKRNNCFRSPLEISNIMECDKSLVIKGCKLLRDKIDITNDDKSPCISHYLPRVCSELNLTFFYEKETFKIYNEIKNKTEINKYDPRLLTAALLYIVYKKQNEEDNIFRKRLSEVLGVTNNCISKIINQIENL